MIDQAQARQRLVENQLADLLAWRRKEEIDQLEAQAAEARAAWELAEADMRRVEQLLNSNAMSVGEFDTASATVSRTKATLEQEEAQLAMAEAGPTEEQKDVAKAQLAVAAVEVRQRERDLRKTKIRAPYNGVIDRLSRSSSRRNDRRKGDGPTGRDRHQCRCITKSRRGLAPGKRRPTAAVPGQCYRPARVCGAASQRSIWHRWVT